MKNGAWRASAPLLSMMAGLPAAAQVAQPSVEDVGQASIDIAGAVAMTLARHPEIARSNAALARGQADLGAAKSAWTPQLTYPLLFTTLGFGSALGICCGWLYC
ncbi:hypothetical protein ACFFHX_10260, partial [Sphingobium indicum]